MGLSINKMQTLKARNINFLWMEIMKLSSIKYIDNFLHNFIDNNNKL